MTDRYVLQTALFREVAETAHSMLTLISQPTPAHLQRLRTIRDDLDRIEAGLVAVLREDGATWDSLAVANGVARQSMYERLKNRAPRWVTNVRRSTGGDGDALRRTLRPAWHRIAAELRDRTQVLLDLDTVQYSNLDVLPPESGLVSLPIDDKRRTSPSRLPR